VKWKISGTGNLTSETSTTYTPSMGAVYVLAIYLQQTHGFSLVLTGKFCQTQLKVGLGGTGKHMAYFKRKRWCQLPG